mmetsp:Transcript_10769/g.39560  ORF Transcript_10769/g.39560 Transcript_10769/m.39560 type:complete len:91 (+) Transcript_10769:1815-2087(+)
MHSFLVAQDFVGPAMASQLTLPLSQLDSIYQQQNQSQDCGAGTTDGNQSTPVAKKIARALRLGTNPGQEKERKVAVQQRQRRAQTTASLL